MLRISKLADYATVVMVYLAHHQDKLCNARDIAIHTHLSMPTVSKILKQLTVADLLVSVRGVSGGYRLSRMPESISVADILFALDEQRGIIECHMKPDDCSLGKVCGIQRNWRMISQAIESALTSVSLATLATPELSAQDAAQVRQLAMGVKRG
ncbi:MAG: SUF system Fe-S cluster assembly regulator [Gammaproteobacteria bacterium]|nr:SUF system Fe-S cluster assembly regulator [Gammaproteobacteria bacterium]